MSEKEMSLFIAKRTEEAAACAAVALKAFRRATGTDPEDAVVDLLADLMHWCLQNGQDFEKGLKRARLHVGDELAGCF